MCEARFEATVQTEWKLCMWLTPVQREKKTDANTGATSDRSYTIEVN